MHFIVIHIFNICSRSHLEFIYSKLKTSHNCVGRERDLSSPQFSCDWWHFIWHYIYKDTNMWITSYGNRKHSTPQIPFFAWILYDFLLKVSFILVRQLQFTNHILLLRISSFSSFNTLQWDAFQLKVNVKPFDRISKCMRFDWIAIFSVLTLDIQQTMPFRTNIKWHSAFFFAINNPCDR